MKYKEIRYAYATSPNAEKLEFGETGCFYIATWEIKNGVSTPEKINERWGGFTVICQTLLDCLDATQGEINPASLKYHPDWYKLPELGKAEKKILEVASYQLMDDIEEADGLTDNLMTSDALKLMLFSLLAVRDTIKRKDKPAILAGRLGQLIDTASNMKDALTTQDNQ